MKDSLFKTITIFGLKEFSYSEPLVLEDALKKMRFTGCAPTQEKTSGWSPPRGEKGAPLVEQVAGKFLFRLMTEAKVLPASVVRRKSDERIEKLEEQMGRKLGRKERHDLRDETLLDMLPHAYTSFTSTWVLIDPDSRLMLVDSASSTRCDLVVAALLRTLDGLEITRMHTDRSPSSVMSAWLLAYEAEGKFDIEDDCELVATDDSGSVVRYKNHSLQSAEVRHHIEAGKVPSRLGLTHDGRTSIMLTDAMQIKRIKHLDGVLGEAQEEAAASRFDADWAIVAPELIGLCIDLIDAFGGETKAEEHD